MKKTSSMLLVAFCLCAAPQAFADIIRPNQAPETCTVALVQGAGESCRECASSFQGPACADTFAGTPLAFRCRTGGASTWTEVWCAPGGVPVGASGTGGTDGSGPAVPTHGSAPAPAEGTAAAPAEASAAPAAEGTATAPAVEGTAAPAEASAAEQAGMTAAPDAPQTADTAPASTRGCASSPVTGKTGFGLGALVAALALIRRRRD